ncbi:hypothetical protein HPB50_021191 [Hyalomma asiaticum]|uniref:Uncharacterized protein n=1 Tax=Hyalomma asiaticum TaxID=266040 RepID=A0ACB7RYD2_HYAAI|nr:hypothetical protein HPB50_021191 [Hyalomma asiaticum]
MEQRENIDDLSPGTAVTAPGNVPSSGVVGVENKVRIHRITSEVRKHELLIEALPPQAMAEIRDILVGPPSETPYTTVKQALLHRLVSPKHRRIQQVLNGPSTSPSTAFHRSTHATITGVLVPWLANHLGYELVVELRLRKEEVVGTMVQMH